MRQPRQLTKIDHNRIDIKESRDDDELSKRLPNVDFKEKILEELRRLLTNVESKDLKKSKALIPELCGKVGEFTRKLQTVEEEILQLKEKLKCQEDDYQQRLVQANQQNKVLRSRNSSLLEESVATVHIEETLTNKMKMTCEAVKHFSDEGKFKSCIKEVNNSGEDEKLTLLLAGLEKLQQSGSNTTRGDQEGSSLVSLVLQDGQTVKFSTNRYNNIAVSQLEKFLSKKVVSVEAPMLVGGGHREMKIVGGYLNCPPLGWGDRLLKVATEDLPGN